MERWAELAVWLEKSKNAKVIWIWGPGEEQEIDDVIKLSGGVGVKSPKTTFRELAALIKESHLFIGNSNGPSHVAVAMDTSSIQLHGPTSAVSWCPMTERHRAVQRFRMDDITLQDIAHLIGT
jgi:ADP-heptose:LPS heptosyltransferase